MELVLRPKRRGAGGRARKAPLKVRVPTSWLESPCERVIGLWKKKHDGSWTLSSFSGIEIPSDWPIEVAVEVYGKVWVVSSRLATDAKELYDAGDYEAARVKAEAAVGECDDDDAMASSLAIRGACSMMLGDYEQCALDCCRAAAKLGDDDALWNRCGRANFALGDFDAARAAYLAVLERGACARGCDSEQARIAATVAARGSQNATSCRDDLRKAQRYFLRGDLSQCVKTAGSVRSRCRGAGGGAAVVCGSVETRGLAALGAWEAAAAVISADLESWKSRPPKGALPNSLDRPSCDVALRALSYCGQLCQAIELARAWTKNEKASQAADWTKDALGSLSQLADTKAAADAAYAAGEYASASRLYDHPHPIMCHNRAAALVEVGDLSAAAAACSAALHLRPFYDKARLRRARCLAKLHQFQLAAADYAELLKRMPSVVRTEANKVFAQAADAAASPGRFAHSASSTSVDNGSQQSPAFDRAAYDAYVRKFEKKRSTPSAQQPSVSKKGTLLAQLGLTENASRGEIKRRYRTLALRLHPDKRSPGNDDDADDEKFREIHHAYKALLLLVLDDEESEQ